MDKRNLKLLNDKIKCQNEIKQQKKIKEKLRTQNMRYTEYIEDYNMVRKTQATVKKAKPDVDTIPHPTDVPKNVACNSNYYIRCRNDHQRILNLNALLATRIKDIYTGPNCLQNKLKPETIKHANTKTLVRDSTRMKDLVKIAFENLKMFDNLQNVKPIISKKGHTTWYKQQEKYLRRSAMYPLLKSCQGNVVTISSKFAKKALKNAIVNPTPLVYMDFEIENEAIGRVIFMLRADLAPITSENFRCLCTGERGHSFKCSEMHKIFPGVCWQLGAEVPAYNGKFLPSEKTGMKHDAEGIISMVTRGPNTVNREFVITAKRMECFDGVYVPFGRVLKGMPFLLFLWNTVSYPSGKPTHPARPKSPIYIVSCGEINSDELNLDEDNETITMNE